MDPNATDGLNGVSSDAIGGGWSSSDPSSVSTDSTSTTDSLALSGPTDPYGSLYGSGGGVDNLTSLYQPFNPATLSPASAGGGGLLNSITSALGSLVGIGGQAYLASQGIAANQQQQYLAAQPFTQRAGITSASGSLTSTGSLLIFGGIAIVALLLLTGPRK